MLDIDPGLDPKLRAFFDHIEGLTPPSRLTDISPVAPDHRRRMINVFAGLAAVAVIAASVTLFAVELRGHRSSAPVVASTSPSSSLLKRMPLFGNGGVPTSARVVIPLTRGRGSVRLKTFIPRGTLLLQFDCAGPSNVEITPNSRLIPIVFARCSMFSGVTTTAIDGSSGFQGKQGYDGTPLTLSITAPRATSWEILVADTTLWFPSVLPVQADQQVLVPLTYGTGSTTLPAFSVAPDESVRVNIVCNSGTSGKGLEIAPNPLWPDGQQVQCLTFNADGSISMMGFGPAVSSSGSGGLGPFGLQFEADPLVSWQIQITEGPEGIILPELGNLGPVTQNVGVAATELGMGSAALPAFTTSQHYTIAFSCSGAGSLTVVTAGVAHVATTNCGGNTGWFTPPAQVPGRPVSLSVDAPSSVGWEIEPVQVYGSTWGAGGATMP